jgi:hypothetical protein
MPPCLLRILYLTRRGWVASAIRAIVTKHPLFTQPIAPSPSHNIWLAIELSETNNSGYEAALTLVVGVSIALLKNGWGAARQFVVKIILDLYLWFIKDKEAFHPLMPSSSWLTPSILCNPLMSNPIYVKTLESTPSYL